MSAVDSKSHAEKVVDHMMTQDAFSRWLGVQVLSVAPGSCRLQMTVRDEMTNGFRTAHGGIQYAFADSALAFASNGHGRIAVAVDNSITYPKPVHAGDVLTAEAEELSLGNTIATYSVRITNQRRELVAIFRGTVFRTKKEHAL